ncbi:MAG: thioredoxin domain-containing protein, partial [Planctomycetes bacterium]|nr:thioredoxin domain-containing protein [Planctomycetota bacterium]
LLCRRVSDLWRTRRADLAASSRQVAGVLQSLEEPAEPGAASGSGWEAPSADAAYRWYRRSFDESHGGFGDAPKFPAPTNLDFLLRYARRTGMEDARRMALATLDHMLRGGMRDHLGGGFHRYSTDRFWLVPHFEKMLYDNALIARTLLDACRISGEARYLEAARETLDYVIGRLQSPEGGFFSAEDADAEGEEGRTYVWTLAEILAALGEERGRLFCEMYGVTAGGNFEEGPASVLHAACAGGAAELAERRGESAAAVEDRLRESRRHLLAIRAQRPQPLCDDKVLVEWNGLAISAAARGHQVMGDARYLEAAVAAASFIESRMVIDGRLRRSYREGEARIDGFLEDHASLADGLLDLYEASLDPRWLEWAIRLGREIVDLFWDEERLGFLSSSRHHEELIVRRASFHDGAIPSGNSMASVALRRLAVLTGDARLARPLDRMASAAPRLVKQAPHACSQLLCGVEFTLQSPLEIVVIGPLEDAATRAMIREVHRRFLPSRVLVHASDDAEAARLAAATPLLEGRVALGGRVTAYVCRGRTCRRPVADAAELGAQLDEL